MLGSEKHVVCPHCGAENPKSAIVTTCQSCLQPLGEAEEPAEDATAPTQPRHATAERAPAPAPPAVELAPSAAAECWSPALRMAALGVALGSVIGLVMRGPVLGGKLRLLMGAAAGALVLVQLVQERRLVDRVKMAAVAWAVAVGTLVLAGDVWRILGRPAVSSWWIRRVMSRGPLLASVSMRDAFLCACVLVASILLALLSARIAAAICRRWPEGGRDWWRVAAIVVAALIGILFVRGVVSILATIREAGPMAGGPLGFMIVPAFIMVGMVVLLALLVRRWVQKQVAECERLAPALGGSVKKGLWVGGAEVVIPTEGCTVTLSPGVGGRGAQLRVPYLPTTRLMCSCTTAWVGIPKVKTGDPAFDADFDVCCNEPEAARAVFANEELRAWLRERPGRYLNFGSEPSLDRLDVRAVQISDAYQPTGSDLIRVMLGLLLESLRRLEEAGFAKLAPPDVVL